MAVPTSLRDTRVKRFSPTGTSDSFDATDEFPGACSAISNLVPLLGTRNLWTCRPGAVLEIDFSTWPVTTNAGIVSVFKVVGTFVYGMCGDVTAGVDKPFAYNLITNTFVTVTITSGSVYPPIIANVDTTGVLPTMDLIGPVLAITHPKYPLTSAGCVGSINISNLAAPSYNTRDFTGALTCVALGAIPSWVVQFNQRAYYGINAAQPSMVASDVLLPNTITNAGQALTFGNNLPLTTAAPLGLSNQLGGIIQSLMVFQGVSNIQQVTGDYALSTWAVNTLNVATGVVQPRAHCSTPVGLAFMSPAGLRIIDPNGTVGDPIGNSGLGVVLPFTVLAGSVNDTLLFSMGCDSVTIRISVWDVASLYNPVEYWYNLTRKVWSGPHFPFAALQYDVFNGGFIAVSNPLTITKNGVYQTSTDPNINSVYTENGSAINFALISALLEDNYQMAESELVEMQIMAEGLNVFLHVAALNHNGAILNSENLLITTVGPSSGGGGLYPFRVDFTGPTVFNRLILSFAGASVGGFVLGDAWLRLRTAGYVAGNT